MSFSAAFIDPVHWETRKATLLCAWKERELSIFCIQPTDFIPTDFIHPLTILSLCFGASPPSQNRACIFLYLLVYDKLLSILKVLCKFLSEMYKIVMLFL